ncbi:MAG: glycosyltransferase family 1 protein [Acidobacteria bacterium]|nr:glycosyltransferase family 1 protein [Acidobacteriota bacterium]
MSILVVAETFLPVVNGVTNSVLRVVEHMTSRGHSVRIVAPGSAMKNDEIERNGEIEVYRTRSLPVPGYGGLRIGIGTVALDDAITTERPDVLHIAAPAVLGARALNRARELGIPTIAIYQTDLAGFASRYHLSAVRRPIWRAVTSLHDRADLTLAPSTAAVWDLRQRGVTNVVRWMRGVDLERFNPSHRDPALRHELAPNGEVIVGYVGRLAREKQVERLAGVSRMPGVRVVIVGDGPMTSKLRRRMPNATFVGFKTGAELSRFHASFDLFVHTGVDETFCQAVQEALASGVPVVAPAAGGPLDLVRHDVNGYLWTEHSAVSLNGAVEELVRHQVKRERLAAMARPSVESRTWSSVMDELEGHYMTVTSGLGFAYREVQQ